MAIRIYILIITLNINGLSAPEKKTQTGWMDKRQDSIYAVYKRPTSDLGTHTDWKWGDVRRYSMQMEVKRKLK